MYFKYKVKYLNETEEIVGAGIGFADSYAEAAEKLQEMYGNDDLTEMNIAWISDDPIVEIQELAQGLMEDEPYIIGDAIKEAIEDVFTITEAFEEE